MVTIVAPEGIAVAGAPEMALLIRPGSPGGPEPRGDSLVEGSQRADGRTEELPGRAA